MVDQGRALADLRGRAESHARRGELDLAHADLDAIRELRGFVPNAIDDAEDLRVVASVRAAEGDLEAAERALRDVIRRAEVHRLPQLLANATQDLAVLLRQVPIDPPAGTKRPCGDELHIGLASSSLVPSMA